MSEPGQDEETPRWRGVLEYAGMALATRVVPLLPYCALRHLARFAGTVVYSLDARGRTTALENLRCAFGEQMSMKRRRQVARASYATFARTMLELFWAPNLTPEFFAKWVEIEGIRDHSTLAKDGRGVIYYCLHASNFEWLSLWTGFHATPSLVLTQRLRNARLAPIIDRLRATTGHTIIPRQRALIRLLKFLQTGGRINMLNDLNIDPDEGGVLIEMFGLKTSATPALAALAKRTGAQIIPSAALPLPDGRYRFVFLNPVEYKPEEPDHTIAQRCWDLLEPTIRQQPELWLWPYKHWRYKPSGPDGELYPAYANTAKRFDKLIRTTKAIQ